ncbi:MAG TPA: alpha/beta fold hydrolase [Pirellulales bacterium]
MPSKSFTAVERGFAERTVLVPGWGFSGDVFSSLELPTNYLIVDDVGEFVRDEKSFVERLAAALDETGDRSAHVLGWSLGAHAALAWATAHPDRVPSLHLVGVRPSYPPDVVETERQALAADPAGHLAHFYRRVFLADDSVRASFDLEQATERALQSRVPSSASLDEQLAFLATQAITAEALRRTQAVLWHGRRDKIAPYEQADELAALAESEFHRFDRGGHAIVFTTEFESRWGEWIVEEGEQNF